jgi:MYXO-CTERM domain-containing protein
MKCRSCGTEIADKAIICYRCGAGTTDPIRKPVAIPPARSPWPSIVIGIAPILIAIYLLMSSGQSAHPRATEVAGGALAVLGIVLLTLRIRRRR